MTGKTFIDGQDIWTAYGAFVTEGGYAGLAQFPSLKAIEYNDWPEENGIEPDLSAPVLDTKNVSIPFAFVGMRIDPFIDMLSDEGYHSFELREIGKTFTLRLVSVGDITECQDLRLVTMVFADDFPLADYEYVAPVKGNGADDGYCIDDKSFMDYGVKILQGTKAQIETVPAVKTALLRNIGILSGAIYDYEAPVKYKSHDVTLFCLMKSDTLETFWRNHDALLYDLVRPQERILTYTNVDRQHQCFYKSMTVKEFIPVNGVWMKFNLTLTAASTGKKVSCFATGIWINKGAWRYEDIWLNNSPDAA